MRMSRLINVVWRDWWALRRDRCEACNFDPTPRVGDAAQVAWGRHVDAQRAAADGGLEGQCGED
jgi:hypothetical protein